MAALIAAHSRPTVPCTARSVWVTCSTAPQPGSSQPGGGDGRQQRGQQQQRGSRLKGAAAEAVAAGGRPRRWQRGEGDTLLRDVNRDRLMGLLTERAAKTLLFYFSELNPTLMQWLEAYMVACPIPTEGKWEDVSGETFLRRLLSMPLEETRWSFYGREQMYAKSSPLGVDPRQIAQRIMEIRGQIAKEWIEELKQVDEENALLMRETMTSALRLDSIPVVDPSQVKGSTHPELMHPDFE